MKVGCLIYYWGDRYKKIGKIAVNSFKKFHPDVNLHVIDDVSREKYKCANFFDLYGGGIHKYMLAYEIMAKNNYDKMIIVGADTITCARLDEFMNNNESDTIVTLDYPYQFMGISTVNGKLVPIFSPLWVKNEKANTHEWSSFPIGRLDSSSYTFVEHHNYNADVICFNNSNCLSDVIKESLIYRKSLMSCKELKLDYYGEQGGLNSFCFLNRFKIKYKDYKIAVAEGNDYNLSQVVYNTRSKGNLCLPFEYQDHSATTGHPPKFPPYEKPWGKYINKFYVDNGKLYTSDKKSIKMWHYCEGIGNLQEDHLIKLMNNYNFKWFNEDTKKFFKEHCSSGDFFEKEFSI